MRTMRADITGQALLSRPSLPAHQATPVLHHRAGLLQLPTDHQLAPHLVPQHGVHSQEHAAVSSLCRASPLADTTSLCRCSWTKASIKCTATRASGKDSIVVAEEEVMPSLKVLLWCQPALSASSCSHRCTICPAAASMSLRSRDCIRCSVDAEMEAWDTPGVCWRTVYVVSRTQTLLASHPHPLMFPPRCW